MPTDISVLLPDLITRDLGEPKRIGHRLYWCCPFHDDRNPSLTLTPSGRHWKCFGCGESGDAVDWVRKRRACSFREAVTFLNGEVADFTIARPRSTPCDSASKIPTEPTAEWQLRAARIVQDCVSSLCGPGGEGARRWLHDRGLNDDTLRHWQVGYNPNRRYLHGLLVHRGVTIPWFDAGSVRSIKVRRPHHKLKYVCVHGGSPRGLFLSQAIVPGLPALVVEGEFDALLGWQEFRDLVNVVTLGSASRRPDALTLRQLVVSSQILLCYDEDEAGVRGIKRWQGLSGRTRVCSLPCGKDLTEFFLLGGDLRGWIGSRLLKNHSYPTRHSTVEPTALPHNGLRVTEGRRQHSTLRKKVVGVLRPTDEQEEVSC